MVSRILAFRPANVVSRLAPRSDACPLSPRDLLGEPRPGQPPLLMVRAPTPAVARGALVAAKFQKAAIALGLPPGTAPAPWFEAVAQAADELAAGLPFGLSAELVLEGEGVTQVEGAVNQAWKLVDTGFTHLALDAVAVAQAERARVIAEVAAPAVERGLYVEVVVPIESDGLSGRRAAALLAELLKRRAPADAVSVRCRAVTDPDGARAQIGALSRLSGALAGLPVFRRGPLSAAVVKALGGSSLRACEDGGLAAGRGEADGSEQQEARAFTAVTEILDALGAGRSALAVVRELERRLVEG
ncbi:MAG: hypothetical protein QM767_16545 [Anaeromyxobacter sp.]